MYTFTLIGCVFVGFTLRICLEYKTETFTLKYLFLRAVLTTCVGIAGFIVYRDYKVKIKISIELYLILVGFFAVFLISVFDKVSQIGLKAYSKIMLKRLLAYAETEEKEKPNGN